MTQFCDAAREYARIQGRLSAFNVAGATHTRRSRWGTHYTFADGSVLTVDPSANLILYREQPGGTPVQSYLYSSHPRYYPRTRRA